ncbi:MAG: glycosyl hydrolase family 28-related protein [Verrucomicrobiota bacterium]|nr:glycoside hydrolase family 55 protein [Limisphaera sp.]MDW8381582.1 glycosyl hydrolase family 28-related protein [Verrucomicrobiota bacterium]
MKRTQGRKLMAGVLRPTLSAIWTSLLALHPAFSQPTEFTYQGRLEVAGQPASGLFDLCFRLYDAEAGGQLLAGPVTNDAIGVTNGLFTVRVDFGHAFIGAQGAWLELGVRTNAFGSFVTLSPRQPLTAVPWAVQAWRAARADQVPAHGVMGALALTHLPPAVLTNQAQGVQLSGTFSGDGSGLVHLNAGALAWGTVPESRLPTSVARTNQFWWVDVRWHGASGTDTADDSAALQRALDAARRGGAGTVVYIPAGTYYVSTNLIVPWGVHLLGDGADNHNEMNPRASRIVQLSEIYNGLCFPYIHNQWVWNLALWGPTGTAQNVGLSISNGQFTANGEQFRAWNVSIRGFGYGYSQWGPSSIRLENCYIYNQNHANVLLEGLIDSLTLANCNLGYNRDAENRPRHIPAIRILGAGLKSLLVENCEIGDVGPVILGGGGGTVTFINNNVERHLATTNLFVTDVSGTLNLIGGRIVVGGNSNAMVLCKGPWTELHLTILAPFPLDWRNHVAPDGSMGTLWLEAESPNARLFSNAGHGFWRSRSSAGWVYRSATMGLSHAAAELPAPSLHARGRLSVKLNPQQEVGLGSDEVWFYGYFTSTNVERRRLAFASGDTFGPSSFARLETGPLFATNVLALAPVSDVPWGQMPVSTVGPGGRTNWAFVNVNGILWVVMTNTAGQVHMKQLAP